MRPDVVAWLMQGDPSVRWQVLRDLEDAPEKVWRAERARVATAGWGARLLSARRPSGHWGRGHYQPKWTCTTYTLQLLRELGLAAHPAATEMATRALEEGQRPDGGLAFGDWGRSELCVTGMVVANGCAFAGPADRLAAGVAFLLAQQLPDGGWNCDLWKGATHGSVHTTLSVLEALAAFDRVRRSDATTHAARRGRAFLGAHALYRSCRTGEVIDGAFLRPHFPCWWHYDVLRALTHFAAVGAPRDPALEDGVERLRERQAADGRWRAAAQYPGAQHLVLEPAREPSRVITLRALRVLRWWDAARATPKRLSA